jgi:hypothetical protein
MIEYAATATLETDALRAKLRNAPPEFQHLIDAERERRGLPMLFAAERRVATPAPAAAPRKVKIAIHRTLVGVAAPGVSKPTTVKNDPHRLPERILPSAWECVARDLREGRHFPIQNGHDGTVLCRSDSPRFRYRFDAKIGLYFELDHDGTGMAWPASGGCSIGMVPLRWEHRFTNGRFVREIHEMRLAHLAILNAANRSTPAYPLAQVRSVQPHEATREAIRLLVDTRLAVKGA